MEHQRHIGFELRNLHNLLKRNLNQGENKELMNNMTGMHCWAISYFHENQDHDIFQKDFEEAFSIRRSTATNILQLMERNGLIVREPVDYDARLKKIILTDKALQVHKRVVKSIQGTEEQLRAGLTEDELETFFSILDKIKKNIE